MVALVGKRLNDFKRGIQEDLIYLISITVILSLAYVTLHICSVYIHVHFLWF